MKFLFLQLPPVSPDGLPARENHPLGAACLILAGRRRFPDGPFRFEILDRPIADVGSDGAILDAIEAARPDILGVTLYVWNVVRARYLIGEARRRLPSLRVIAGGPEVVAGRRDIFEWGIDVGVPGEGEGPFVAILERLAAGGDLGRPEGFLAAPGLLLPPARGGGAERATPPAAPIASLDALESPYLAGLVDAGLDRFLYLETTRGCRFHCSFCRYDAGVGGPLKFLSLPRVEEILRHAVERRVREVFLLDPTLNQRPDTCDLLRALERGNPGRPGGGKLLRFGGELVAELVDEEAADLLLRAGFHTVEVGLQSTNPETLRLIRRFHHRDRFLRGVRLLKERGIHVRVDLIVGMPAETLASMKSAIDFVAANGLGEDIQVFELMVLPGTALAREAETLGIEHLSRPPYTVLRTPTMSEAEIAEAVAYSEEKFGLSWSHRPSLRRHRREERIDLAEIAPPAGLEERLAAHRRSYLALEARSRPWSPTLQGIRRPLAAWLAKNPFASVDVLLRGDGAGDLDDLEALVEAIQPGEVTLGAQLHRRVWTCFPPRSRASAGEAWLERARRFSLVRFARGRGAASKSSGRRPEGACT